MSKPVAITIRLPDETVASGAWAWLTQQGGMLDMRKHLEHLQYIGENKTTCMADVESRTISIERA